MTDSEREEYQGWRLAKTALRATTLAFAAAVGRGAPEAQLMEMAHAVAALQSDERKRYASLRLKLSWRRLTGVTTWPTPLASAFGEV